MAKKIADALDVTLDYLVKEAEYEQIDNDTLKRLKEVQGLDPENRSHAFATIGRLHKSCQAEEHSGNVKQQAQHFCRALALSS